jgi:DNA-binding NtrC family response regulator
MNYKNPFICVVEDDPSLNKLLSSYLKSKGYKRVTSFHSGEDFIESLNDPKNHPEIVMEDHDLTGMNGLEVMKKTKEINKDIKFIFLSGQDSIKVAVEALKLGAFDYIVKDAGSKENAVNKIKNLQRIEKLITDKKAFKILTYVFIILFLSSWTIIGILIHWGIL